MAKNIYRGFSTKFYGKCNGTNTTVDFSLKDLALIKQDLLNHIFTSRGERYMQPTFGTIIPDIIFEPLTDEVVVQIEEEIVRVIRSDPRVSLLNIQINGDPDFNTVTINLLLEYIELDVVDGFEFNIEFN